MIVLRKYNFLSSENKLFFFGKSIFFLRKIYFFFSENLFFSSLFLVVREPLEAFENHTDHIPCNDILIWIIFEAVFDIVCSTASDLPQRRAFGSSGEDDQHDGGAAETG